MGLPYRIAGRLAQSRGGRREGERNRFSRQSLRLREMAISSVSLEKVKAGQGWSSFVRPVLLQHAA